MSEVALGKEFTITNDDGALKEAPAGYDSVVARGSVEPGTILPQLYYTHCFYKFSVNILRAPQVCR